LLAVPVDAVPDALPVLALDPELEPLEVEPLEVEPLELAPEVLPLLVPASAGGVVNVHAVPTQVAPSE
jgi:hypothetical protein